MIKVSKNIIKESHRISVPKPQDLRIETEHSIVGYSTGPLNLKNIGKEQPNIGILTAKKLFAVSCYLRMEYAR